MKTTGIASLIALALLLATPFAAPAFADTYPTTYSTSQTVSQTNWRGTTGVTFGTVTPGSPFDDSGSGYDYYAATSSASITDTINYEPTVTNQVGGTQTYIFDSSTGDYVMTPNTISYLYNGVETYNVWDGSISFGGAEISSTNTAVTTGQLNQWVLVCGGSAAPSAYPNAIPAGAGVWLVGFSTYTYGSTPTPSITYPGGAFWTLAQQLPYSPCPSGVPQFPLGIAALFALMAPVLLVLRKYKGVYNPYT